MAEAELIPYTEEELYVVPKKEPKEVSAKICQMAADKAAVPGKGNFFKENKALVIAVVVLVIGVSCYLYYDYLKTLKEEKKKKK